MLRSSIAFFSTSCLALLYGFVSAADAQQVGSYVVVVAQEADIISGKEVVERVSRGMALQVRGTRPDWVWVTRQANGWVASKAVMPVDFALNYLAAEIAEQPENPALRNDRATIYLEIGRSDLAIRDYTAALQLVPQSVALRVNRAVAHFEKGEYQQAVADMDEVIRLHPNEAENHVERGWSRYHAGQFAEALADYQQALKLDPNSTGAIANLAWLRATCPDEKFRDGAEALKLAELVCELTEQKDPFALSTLAAALAEQGDLEAALAKQQQALELSPYTKRKLYRQRLAFFAAGQPYRLGAKEPAPVVKATPEPTGVIQAGAVEELPPSDAAKSDAAEKKAENPAPKKEAEQAEQP